MDKLRDYVASNNYAGAFVHNAARAEGWYITCMYTVQSSNGRHQGAWLKCCDLLAVLVFQLLLLVTIRRKDGTGSGEWRWWFTACRNPKRREVRVCDPTRLKLRSS
eukprot:3413451-Alexandrium_andersonii.AAC.1